MSPFYLAIATVVISTIIPSANPAHSILDSVTTFGALIVYSVPVFWLAQMLVLLFSINLHWLPSIGIKTLRVELTGIDHIVDVARHLLLPAVALGAGYLALMMRLTRARMLRVLREDYITMAKAKGLSENKVTYKHAFRNALLPVVTVIGLQVGLW